MRGFPLAEWLYEAGIGEQRAICIDDYGRIIATEIDRDSDGPRCGAVLDARLTGVDPATGRAEIALDCDGAPLATLTRVPKGVATGARLRVRITRSALREAGRTKPARADVAAPDEPLCAGPTATERAQARGGRIHVCTHFGPDRFEEAGWSELTDAARTGHWPFDGGALVISPTPAMTLIDIDGGGSADALALAGAQAAARAIGALGITGSIGIDFPSVAGRAIRQQIADTVDALMPQPFERTAVNGFGLMQIVRRRTGPSLVEREHYSPAESDAVRLLRMAERAQGAGPLTLTVRPAVAAMFDAHPVWLSALGARTGRPVTLAIDPAVKGTGHAQ